MSDENECYCAVEPWPGGAWPDPCDYCMRKAKEHDARADDMAELCAQLADAKAVIEAARRLENAYLTVSHGECLREMYVALKNYEAKHKDE